MGEKSSTPPKKKNPVHDSGWRSNCESENPLICFGTHFNGVAPFESVQLEHYEPALTHFVDVAKDKIKYLHSVKNPNFENFVLPLSNAFKGIQFLYLNLRMRLSRFNEDEVKDLNKRSYEAFIFLINSVYFDQILYEKLKTVTDHSVGRALEADEIKLIQSELDDFEQNGVNLSDEVKTQIQKKQNEFNKTRLDFDSNKKKIEDQAFIEIDPEKDLEGCHPAIKSALETVDGKMGLLRPHISIYILAMKSCKNRELRKRIFLQERKKGTYKGELGNAENVKKIIQLKQEIANLKNYSTVSEEVLKDKMLPSSDLVLSFLDELKKVNDKQLIKDLDRLSEAAKTDGIFDFKPWDSNYYQEQIRQTEINLDTMIVREYFEFEKVILGVFAVYEKLYNVKIEKAESQELSGDDLWLFKVFDGSKNNKLIGLLFLDPYLREGKNSGAFASPFSNQTTVDSIDNVKQIFLLTNGKKPTPDQPSLMNLFEVQTLFHEIGHAFHNLFYTGKYPSLGGTDGTPRDFVEFPSQFMENFVFSDLFINNYALHYQTEEPLPNDLLEKILIDRSLFKAGGGAFNIHLSQMDIQIYDSPDFYKSDIKDFELDFVKNSPIEFWFGHSDDCLICSVSHIFSGGYSSNYYSYFWTEVLSSSVFMMIKENPKQKFPAYIQLLNQAEKHNTIELLQSLFNLDLKSNGFENLAKGYFDYLQAKDLTTQLL